MTLIANPAVVSVDASCIITVSATPNKAVYWGVSGSTGTLAALSTYTDDQGRAVAIFTPGLGEEGSIATITATYGI